VRAKFWILGSAAVAAATGTFTSPGRAETQPTPPAAFAQCVACHSTEPNQTVYGPSLAGIARRRAGSLPGYAYSPALKASGLTWNAATLDRWLTSPQRTVPGTRMPFTGIADPAARKAVVDYLLSLRQPKR
jgi:cytochrome c